MCVYITPVISCELTERTFPLLPVSVSSDERSPCSGRGRQDEGASFSAPQPTMLGGSPVCPVQEVLQAEKEALFAASQRDVERVLFTLNYMLLLQNESSYQDCIQIRNFLTE